jgi:hypothetical protein
MRYQWLKIAIIGAALLLVLPESSQAQESGAKMIPESSDGLQTESKTGWHPLLTASANLASAHNENMPGTSNGLNLQFGYIIFGAVDYLNPTMEHEWDTSLFWQLGFSKTPAIDLLLKSADTIDFRTAYLYHIPKVPWLGPFVAFRLTAPMLPASEASGDDTNVIRLNAGEDLDDLFDGNGAILDPTRVEVVPKDTKIETTSAFSPLVLRESVGMFAIPLDKPWMRIDIRLGWGAWEVFVRDGEDYMVEDTVSVEDTAAGTTNDYLVLRQLQDSIQTGPEFGIIFKGIVEERFTYRANALFMQPVAYSDVITDLDGWELLNMEFEAILGVKLWKFLSIDYVFRAYKQPLVVENWQLQNNLLLSVGFDIIGPKPAPAKDECECPEPAPIVAAEEVTGETEEAAETESTESAPEPADSEAAPADESAAAAPAEADTSAENPPATEDTAATPE